MDQGSPKRVILLGITLISVSYFLLGAANPVAFLFGDWARFGVGMSCMGALAGTVP